MPRLTQLVATGGLLCACAWVGVASAEPGWTLLKGATLYSQVPGEAALAGAELAVDNVGVVRCIGVSLPEPATRDVRRHRSCQSHASGADVIDLGGRGAIIPNLIESSTHAGQIEVDAEEASHDGVAGRQSNTAQVRAIDGVSMAGRSIEAARMGGIGVLVASPLGAALVSGQSVAFVPCGQVVDDAVLKSPVALAVHLGEEAKRDEPLVGARSGQLAQLRSLLQNARRLLPGAGGKQRPTAAESDSLQKLKDDPALQPLVEVMAGKVPLAVHAHRADDIAAALRLQKELGFAMILVGGAEAHLVADRLVAQKVAVVLAPVTTRPYDFATRRAADDNAVRLHKAGVTLVLATGDTHNVRNLRWQAGAAVALGMPWQAALDAVTVTPGTLLGLQPGLWSIAVGAPAHFTAYDGDPLGYQGHVRWTACRGQVTPRPTQR